MLSAENLVERKNRCLVLDVCDMDDFVFTSLIHALKYPTKISFGNRVGIEESAHFIVHVVCLCGRIWRL